MRVYLDEQEVDGAGLTLGSALDAARGVAEARGRVIVEVWADGERTPDDDLETPPTFEPYADEVRMVSATAWALVASVLLDSGEALEQAKQMQLAAAQNIQVGETGVAMGLLGQALGVWEAVRQAVHNGCALVGRSPAELLGEGGASIAEATEGLLSRLGEVRDFVAAEDWSAAADALEFDLVEEADRWSELLTRLAERVREAGSGA